MLPFSKPKNAGEEIELDDDDLVLVESPPPSFSSPPPRLLGCGADEAQMQVPARPRRVTASVSRRIIDESIADGVAGECLSAIAAASRDRHSSSHVRAAIARPRPPGAPPPPRGASAPPPASLASATAAPSSRLPSVSPPPFVRTSAARLGRPAAPSPERAQPPSSSTHESARPTAFVRRSSPMIAVPRTAPGSDAPMSLSPRTAEPTVIVVRERPKAAWVIGAAAIGAVFAVLASRLVMANDAPVVAAAPQPPTSVAVPGAAAPLAVVVAPVAPAAPVAPPSASVTVMRFGDDQGVAFKAPPRPPAAPTATPDKVAQAPASASAPRPRASAVGPTLPDGSLSLGGAPVSTTRTPPAPPPPAAAPKRALTPEQQLAEAQLKASMR